MILIYVANIIVTLLVGTLLFVFNPIDSVVFALNIVFLLITLEIPTGYLITIKKQKISKNDNEMLIPSILVTGFMFIVNIVFYSVCIGVHSNNCKLFILYTIIFHSVIISTLLIIKSITNYITNQH